MSLKETVRMLRGYLSPTSQACLCLFSFWARPIFPMKTFKLFILRKDFIHNLHFESIIPIFISSSYLFPMKNESFLQLGLDILDENSQKSVLERTKNILREGLKVEKKIIFHSEGKSYILIIFSSFMPFSRDHKVTHLVAEDWS